MIFEKLLKNVFSMFIKRCISIQRLELNRGHDVKMMIETFMVSIWKMTNRFFIPRTRHDNSLVKISAG